MRDQPGRDPVRAWVVHVVTGLLAGTATGGLLGVVSGPGLWAASVAIGGCVVGLLIGALVGAVYREPRSWRLGGAFIGLLVGTFMQMTSYKQLHGVNGSRCGPFRVVVEALQTGLGEGPANGLLGALAGAVVGLVVGALVAGPWMRLLVPKGAGPRVELQAENE